jgi:predicted transglutaminase-like cysteine proteinase
LAIVLSFIFVFILVSEQSYAVKAESLAKVKEVKQRFKEDGAAARRLKSWKVLLSNKTPRTISELLEEANDFFNKLSYISDSQLNQKADVWKTPYEFLAEGGGDCEDFAIAKYFSLVIMGVPEKRLRITYVTIPSRNLAHMVLTYYPTPNSEPYILDNLTNEILPASKRTDLIPVYSFNRGQSWLNDRMGKSRKYGKPTDLSKWRELLYRLKLEEEN